MEDIVKYGTPIHNRTLEKTGHLSQSHTDYFPHLCYVHAPLQHLEDNQIDLVTYT